jgi:hypothetical protein
MNAKTTTVAIAAIALVSTLALAADDTNKKPAAAAKTTAKSDKPADKGAQGGIILQNQGGKPADKGAQGGIILQNQGAKAAQKAPAAANKSATQKGTAGSQ